MSVHNDESRRWMVWDDAYELGIPTVDEQHRHLVCLCNNFRAELMNHSSREGGGWQTALSEALRETVQYTKNHFIGSLLNLSGIKDSIFSFFCRNTIDKMQQNKYNIS